MGAKQSASGGSRLRAYQHDGTGHGSLTSPDVGLAVSGPSSSGVSRRTRTRSLGIVQNSAQHGRPLSIPNPNRDGNGVLPTDSDASTPDDDDIFRGGLLQASSLPLPMRLFSINGKLIGNLNWGYSALCFALQFGYLSRLKEFTLQIM